MNFRLWLVCYILTFLLSGNTIPWKSSKHCSSLVCIPCRAESILCPWRFRAFSKMTVWRRKQKREESRNDVVLQPVFLYLKQCSKIGVLFQKCHLPCPLYCHAFPPHLFLYQTPQSLHPAFVTRFILDVGGIEEDEVVVLHSSLDRCVYDAVQEHAQWVDAQGLVGRIQRHLHLYFLVLALNSFQGDAQGIQFFLQWESIIYVQEVFCNS